VALHLVTLEKPAWKIPLRWILKSFDFESSDTCNFPSKSEVTEISFTGHKERAKNLLVIIHFDVCSPINVVANSGFVYLQNDSSRYMDIYMKRRKYGSFEIIRKVFKNEVEVIVTRKLCFYNSIAERNI
jgi:hypothetical protein